MNLIISPLSSPPPDAQPVEVVECKGKGHPDTICDNLAEELGLALVRFYREETGLIHHHNVDKALLWAGSARPAFGAGEVIEPIEVFLCGRATQRIGQRTVPVEDLALQSARSWLSRNLHALDAEKQVRIHPLIRPGSADLAALFEPGPDGDARRCNDTSCGVGYAPLSELERLVLRVEQELSSQELIQRCPAIGEDIKVMGLRKGDCIDLTLSCALIGGHLHGLDDYMEMKKLLAGKVMETAAQVTARPASVAVNAADDLPSKKVYLTVTGTSAEAGDDGQAGRGNRVGGLITPGRPMVMESVAGKNPVTHVGKIYNVIASQIASDLVEEIEEIREAHCFLVSRIGSPVKRPQLIQLRLGMDGNGTANSRRPVIEQIVQRHLEGIDTLWEELMKRTIRLF